MQFRHKFREVNERKYKLLHGGPGGIFITGTPTELQQLHAKYENMRVSARHYGRGLKSTLDALEKQLADARQKAKNFDRYFGGKNATKRLNAICNQYAPEPVVEGKK